MTLINPGYYYEQAYNVGIKLASTGVAYNLSGILQVSSHQGKPWGLLSVPNSLVRGIYDAMDEPGIELPPSDSGKFNAHITVFRPEDIVSIGGIDKLKERGKSFTYTLGRLVELTPRGWPEMQKAWVVKVHSPELQKLRKTYGLSSLPNDGKYDFHVTVAVRRRGVLSGSQSRA